MRKKRIGSIGCSVRSSQATNATSSAAPAASEPTIDGLVQPSAFPFTSPQTTPSRPPLASARPGRSSALSGPWLSRSRANASGASSRPTGTFSQKIHCHEIPSITAPPTSGPLATAIPPIAPQIAERDAAALGRKGVGEDRQRQRHHERAAEALHRPRGDQRLHRRRERGRRGREREDAEADAEHAPAAEAVAERGAGEQEDGERERVGVHRPFELLDRRAEVDADDGERGRDDEVVEHDHEERDRGDRERPDRVWAAHGAPFSVVSSHYAIQAKKEAQTSSLQPSISRRAHGSSELSRSIAATTLRSMPWAKKPATSAGPTPDTRSVHVNRSP